MSGVLHSVDAALHQVGAALHITGPATVSKEEQKAALVNLNPRNAALKGIMKAIWHKKDRRKETPQEDLLQVTGAEPDEDSAESAQLTEKRTPPQELLTQLFGNKDKTGAAEEKTASVSAGTVRLLINQVPYTLVQPDPQLTLAKFLRVTLGLTGTKIGCNEGGCGACMVSIARKDATTGQVVQFSANSCLRQVAMMDGEAVITVEGLGSVESGLHPIQQSMVVHGGTQCGYCTPGHEMAMYGLLAGTGSQKGKEHLPSHRQIEQALDGNLCRCTGYRPILSSMKAVVPSGASGASASSAAAGGAVSPTEQKTPLHPCGKGSGSDCSSDSKDACASKGVGCGFSGAACSNDLEDLVFDPANPRHNIDPFAVNKKGKASRSCKSTAAQKGSCASSGGAAQDGAVTRQTGFWWTSSPTHLFLHPASLEQLLHITKFYAQSASTAPLALNGSKDVLRVQVGGTSPGVARYYRRNGASDDPTVVVQVAQLPELLKVEEEASHPSDNGVRGLKVGAAVTIASLITLLESRSSASLSFGPLAYHLRQVASTSLRAVASWAGNLALAQQHPDFPSDLLTIFSAAGASVQTAVAGEGKGRSIPLLEWQATKLEQGEVLLALFVPAIAQSETGALFRTYKTRGRNTLAHPIVNFAGCLRPAKQEAVLTFGGAQDGLFVARQTAAKLLEVTTLASGAAFLSKLTPAGVLEVIGVLAKEVDAALSGPSSCEAGIAGQQNFEEYQAFSKKLLQTQHAVDTHQAARAAAKDSAPSPMRLEQALHERPAKRNLPSRAYRRQLVLNLAYKFLLELMDQGQAGNAVKEGAAAAVAAFSQGAHAADDEKKSSLFVEGTPTAPSISANASAPHAGQSARSLAYSVLEKERPITAGVQDFSGAADPLLAPVGLPFAKLEADIQCSGEAKFTNDLDMAQGVHFANSGLFGAHVFSTVAAGTLLALDGTQAMKVPGVVRLVTARDISAIGGMNECGQFPGDEEIFASREVFCVGQSLGLVLADTELAAETGARLVRATYGPPTQPACVSLDEAVAMGRFFPDRPDDGQEMQKPVESGGDVDKALDKAKHRFKGTNRSHGAYHFALETQSAYCVPSQDGRDGGMDVYSASQGTQHVREAVSRALGRPAHKFVVHTKHTGGGFGSKLTRNVPMACATAVACQVMGRPVKVQHSRYADMEIVGKRPEFRCDYEIGCDDDGKVTALKLKVYLQGGCTYDSNFGTFMMATMWSDNAYHFPVFSFSGAVARTNTLANTSMRGPGNVRTIWNAEMIMERVSHELGLDPAVVRERNFYTSGAQLTPYKQPLFHCHIQDVWKLMRSKLDYEGLVKQCATFNAQSRYRKRSVGVAAVKYGVTWQGPDNHHGCSLSVYAEDGSIHVAHSGAEMGQGINTKVALTVVHGINFFLAAANSKARVTLSDVHIAEANSAYIANAGLTGGSSGSETCCHTANKAAQELGSRLASVLRANPDAESWADIVSAAAEAQVHLQVLYDHNETQLAFNYFVFASALSLVELDVLTGAHQVLHTEIVYDNGAPLAPIVDIGQIEGGFTIGLGHCTTEELQFDPITGELLTKGSWDYHIPTAQDIPHQLNVTLLPGKPNDKLGILSSKATAEPPVMLSQSVHFALRHAVASARADNGRKDWFDWPMPATAQTIQTLCLADASKITTEQM